MAADAFKTYNGFGEWVADGTIDLDADAFKGALFLSTSNAATLTVLGYASLTNEHANANGYTTGGIALTSVTWNRSANVTTFDSADPVWTASGGDIVARFFVIYDDTVTTPTADPNCCYTLMDNTPADVTATDGNTLTIQMAVTGIFTFTTSA